MGAELPRPGVEVVQVFRSTSPTVVTPTLVPCVVGLCRQVVDVLVAAAGGGSVINSDALVPLPAQFIAVDGPYSGLDGLKLAISITGNPELDITFTGTPLTAAQVVSQVNAALADAGVDTAEAKVAGDGWVLRTTAVGSFQSLQVLAASDSAVLSAFGLGPRTYVGHDGYDQHRSVVAQSSFPDPRKNLSQLAIENLSIRAFLLLGGVTPKLQEFLRTQSFLRNGLALPAVMTFTGDLTGVGVVAGLDTQTLSLVINGGSALVTTFAAPATPQDVVDQVNAVINAVATASLSSNGKFLIITTLNTNPTATIAVPTGSATGLGFPVAPVVGVTAAKTVTPSNGQTVSALLQFPGKDFTAVATAAAVTGTVNISSVVNGHTLVLDDGVAEQTITFNAAVSSGAILAQINAVMGTAAGGRLTASLSTGKLHLVNSVLGAESVVKVVSGTALAELGLVAATTAYGNPFPVAVGDDVYIDGLFFATVVQVAPGAAVDTLKINKNVPLNTNLGTRSFYINAKNLTNSALFGISRPTPNLQVDLEGRPILKNDVLRDVSGAAISGGKATLYLAYSAVRQDVSAIGSNPGLLRFNDTLSLNDTLAPLSPVNPLALGLYFALLNSPGVQVTGLGVDAVSANAPFGTVEAFTRAAEFLEAFEVYAIAPMTHDQTVGQIFNTHVTVMSQPANKGERICLFNPSKPTNKLDTLVASGVDGNSTQSTNEFDTGIQNLGALLLGVGIDPNVPIPVSDGLYLAIADSSNKYAVVSISGSIVTVKTSSFSPGDNDDGYYATTSLSGTLIEEAFALRVRGAALTTSAGQPDKDGIADTYAGAASTFLNRRFWNVAPDECAATINGLEQEIDGFYMCAAIAGMIGQQPPQQSFTNFPMTGFTRVIGSNDFFTEHQLNRMAAGGNYIIVQDAQGAPLTSRMALTTDLTSIETRTDSITKVVDFCAKFLRRGLKNFIGRFNITQGFLDSLGHVIQGLLGFLSETGVLIGSHLNNIIQDESAPDTVLVDITLDVPFPCNYIRLTLVV